LFAATFCTATVAGMMEPFGPIPLLTSADPSTIRDTGDLVAALPEIYFGTVAFVISLLLANGDALLMGLSFSVPLLFILLCHELGHYIACRRYGVSATLPFFIPMPPLLGPAGTLGAFIKIKSRLPSRRATFDIGVAGPLAGFVAVIPVIVIGLLTMQQVPEDMVVPSPDSIYFSDPLLTHIVGFILGADPSRGYMNPFLAAGWLGLLVTALNLIPSGQLDGGHAVFAVFGQRALFWTGRIAFVLMVALCVVGWFLYSVPGAVLFTVILGIMMRIKHPEPLDDTPLDRGRLLIALITLLVFALSFTPFPVKIG
jgi:membrane-associated protease RseP (regulator of RpoE activity)